MRSDSGAVFQDKQVVCCTAFLILGSQFKPVGVPIRCPVDERCKNAVLERERERERVCVCERERERKREKKKKDTANQRAAPSEHQVSPKPNGPQRATVNQHVQQKHQQWRQPSSGKCITDLKHGNGVTLKAPLEILGSSRVQPGVLAVKRFNFIGIYGCSCGLPHSRTSPLSQYP